ncbi:MAG: branched-chain amino acid ABC transporter permease [Reyranellaceae bacterium]
MSGPVSRLVAYWRARPNTPLVLLAALVAGAVAARDPAWLDIAIGIVINALVALSVGLMFGQAGLLSAAQGSFAAVGAYVSGILAAKLGWSPWITLPLAVLVPAALGYGLARLVARLAPLAVALATLTLSAMVEIVLRSWDDLTGGYVGLAGIPPVFAGQPVAFYALAVAILAVSVLAYENLMGSRFGRGLTTVRGDRARALADGIAVPGLLSAAFAVSAAMAGAGGWLYAHYFSYLSPGSLGTELSISVLLMMVVGGARTILGPVVGAVILGVLAQLLPAQEVQGLFYGGALIVILLVARNGLLGLVRREGTS